MLDCRQTGVQPANITKSRGRTWIYNTVGDYPLWGDGGTKSYETRKNAYAEHMYKTCVSQYDEPTAD